MDFIDIYSRADALADGVLIDVSETAKEAGFKIPVAITSAAHFRNVYWTDKDSDLQTYQDESGRLWDVLYMAAYNMRIRKLPAFTYQMVCVPRDGQSVLPEEVELKLVIDQGDHGEPVVTIMLPEED